MEVPSAPRLSASVYSAATPHGGGTLRPLRSHHHCPRGCSVAGAALPAQAEGQRAGMGGAEPRIRAHAPLPRISFVLRCFYQ